MMNKSIKLSIRTLLRHNRFLIFSIVSLTICLSLIVLTSAYYAYEMSCDKYQGKYDRIYRLVNTSGNHVRLDEKYYNTLLTGVSGIEKVCRINIFGSMLTSGEALVNIKNLVIADSSIFGLFEYNILIGSGKHLLDAPDKIVLSKSLAEKLFGSEDPLGKAVRVNMVKTVYVSGVFDDIKEKSHFKSDAIVSLYTDNLPWAGGNFGNQRGTWKVRIFSYYILINERANPENVTDQIKRTYDFPWYSSPPNIEIQPLSDIFTNSSYKDERISHLNKPLAGLLLAISLIVMIIAGINYINLNLSNMKAESRMVSILKVHGANRNDIFRHYMVSGGLLIMLSLVIAIVLSDTLLPYFNQLVNSEVQINILTNFSYLIPFCGILVILFFSIGLYPAWLFSGITPVNLFQGKTGGKIRLSIFSRILLVFQFTAAIALIASVLIIFEQIAFMKNKNPGFEPDYLIKQDLHYSINNPQIIKAYARELLKNPEILKLTLTDGIPLGINSYSHHEINGHDVKYNNLDCDTSFFSVLGIKLVNGRTFYDSDKRNVCIITEKLAKETGFGEPVNEKINNMQVIGVVSDFNSMSMHQELNGVLFMPLSDYISNIILRINGTNIPQTISYMEKTWKDFFPEYPFNYQFYDDLVAQQYEKEQKLANSISLVSGLAIFLCCLGLLGLVLNMVENRVKEIGIRKVNGARITEVLIMLNKDFLRWVAVAFIIATPIAYIIMKRWIQNFAYKTSLSWWIFLLAGLIVLFIALLTVTWQSWRVATKNPVDSLRYE
jgi:putative ABC transport system permease protein